MKKGEVLAKERVWQHIHDAVDSILESDCQDTVNLFNYLHKTGCPNG